MESDPGAREVGERPGRTPALSPVGAKITFLFVVVAWSFCKKKAQAKLKYAKKMLTLIVNTTFLNFHYHFSTFQQHVSIHIVIFGRNVQINLKKCVLEILFVAFPVYWPLSNWSQLFLSTVIFKAILPTQFIE